MDETRSEEGFYVCPFCPCVYCAKSDLERHMVAFGNEKQQHLEKYRRCHARVEFSSAE